MTKNLWPVIIFISVIVVFSALMWKMIGYRQHEQPKPHQLASITKLFPIQKSNSSLMNKDSSAIVLVDYQNLNIKNNSVNSMLTAATNIKLALEKARAAKVPIIYLNNISTPNAAHVSLADQQQKNIWSKLTSQNKRKYFSMVNELQPQKDDYIVSKTEGGSIFAHSDLSNLIQLLKVNTVILAGISNTSDLSAALINAKNMGLQAFVLQNSLLNTDKKIAENHTKNNLASFAMADMLKAKNLSFA